MEASFSLYRRVLTSIPSLQSNSIVENVLWSFLTLHVQTCKNRIESRRCPFRWYLCYILAVRDHYLTLGCMTIAYWPIWFVHCGCARHTCLTNVSPNHVICLTGWFKLVINPRNHSSLKPLFWPWHVTNVYASEYFSRENLTSIAKYCNTNHWYCLAIKGYLMSPQTNYL